MKKLVLLHPVLIAASPVLFLYAEEVRYVHSHVVVSPLLVSLAAATLLWAVCRLVLRDASRASLLTSVVLLPIYSFQYVQRYLEESAIPGLSSISSALFLFAWVGIAAAVYIIALRTRKSLDGPNRGIAVFALLILLLPTARIVRQAVWKPVHVTFPDLPLQGSSGRVSSRPDIYYIILDGGARHDVLRELYQYDDAWFLDSLEHIGFQVLRNSRANYNQTMMSLASSLNMSYIDDLVPREFREESDRRPLHILLNQNTVFRVLSSQGYTLVDVASGYTGTELQNVDVHLDPLPSINEFDSRLFSGTLLAPLADYLEPRWREIVHRRRVLYSFEALSTMQPSSSPRMVFAHIVAPHPPFVFGTAGEMPAAQGKVDYNDGRTFFPREQYVERYRSQLRYVEGKVLQAISALLRSATTPPVIILQADHGPGSLLDWDHIERSDFRERMSILNALFLPGPNPPVLPDTLTPVNTFRIILGHYFQIPLPLLPNVSYVSTWLKPYDYVVEIH